MIRKQIGRLVIIKVGGWIIDELKDWVKKRW
jgi:hypothetical protein